MKLIPALIYRKLFSWRETAALGILLSSRLSLIIAAAAISLKLGLITTGTNSAIILVAVLTCTFSPLLFSKILPPKLARKREGIIIVGTDQFAVLLGQRLGEDESVVFTGQDQKQLAQFKAEGAKSVSGEPTDEKVLIEAGIENVKALIAVSNSPEIILEVCRLAKEKFEVPIIIARSDNQTVIQKLQEMKVQVVQPALAAAIAVEGALKFPAAFGMIADRRDNVDLVDVRLKNHAYNGRSLRKIRLPGDALVIGIQRQGEFVVPHGDTTLKYDDVLVLIGSPKSLFDSQRLLNGL